VLKSRLRTGRNGIPIPAGATDLTRLRNVQTVSAAHPAFYLIDMGASSLGSKADHSFSSTAEAKKECLELYPSSSYMPSRREQGLHLPGKT
jgi:hypothetical protein